jgi:hypothetical protein
MTRDFGTGAVNSAWHISYASISVGKGRAKTWNVLDCVKLSASSVASWECNTPGKIIHPIHLVWRNGYVMVLSLILLTL